MKDTTRPIRRALVSVYDKSGINELAEAFISAGTTVVSTGSTAKRLSELGVNVTEVEEITGFPESLNGRVKTLDPHIHAGILADMNDEEQARQLKSLDIEPFDLVVGNLYPFADTVRSGASEAEMIEKIDIGGPSMIRGAAKNSACVTVISDPSQYSLVAERVVSGTGFSLEERRWLAAKAFAATAAYDARIAEWTNTYWFEPISLSKSRYTVNANLSIANDGVFVTCGNLSDAKDHISTPNGTNRPAVDVGIPTAHGDMSTDINVSIADSHNGKQRPDVQFPPCLTSSWDFAQQLSYGENPHQRAALYTNPLNQEGLAHAEQLGGKPMSYNNYVDADSAWRAVWDFAPEIAVAICKHNNPCGLAIGKTVAEAHLKAHACDPMSAYGGVIAANSTITLEMAENISPIFTEVIVAPDYKPAALQLLKTCKKNLRILKVSHMPQGDLQLRQIEGGVLMQSLDKIDAPGDGPLNWKLVSGKAVDASMLNDLAFAWKAIRCVKSNAVLLAHDRATVGIGMGQVNRVDTCHLAVQRANTLADGINRSEGSVAASDAFFPFADGVEVLIDAGVKAIVQPGGSIRDDEVIEAARRRDVTMYLTGTRHFMH
ncbi:phosphoribosylaminoimidazolecarboxamide formyltransferase/IMP cyclohydrolase [Bifidobacterium commune]|uniref:Bifunctional purine biosynthesis protein PurH n=1 Tax=Bifidobacterium commune TaxID=1505727 RepID=A0A1C4H1P2_9BIFI|nr:bifunctional phosphoribosylaminoimidazolecarboxamide formyltransferase/IMP cyclohydrolase [Bifidobacterium commune]MBB2954818.1 phosphoribosylaminoimidazolecarboxamide formyltransferase/IMP cyclohydrolase [Bifidobacterium commune]SCC78847.1 MGS-like domain-containing protein [Bifidobacterium commune]